MKSNLNHFESVSLAVGLGFMMLAANARAQQPSAATESAFSFDVYGDSRSMMYLPYKKGQEADAKQLMVDMFELVLPAKVSQAVVDKDVKLTYDPAAARSV